MPTFDETRPEGLQRYFNDLQILLDGKGVTNNKTCKEAAVRYVEVETEELWTTTNAWKDQTKTFAEFKDEIFKLYPGASKDRTYTIQDLDLVTGHYAWTGILTSLHLGEYYRKFLRISRYLIEKGNCQTKNNRSPSSGGSSQTWSNKSDCAYNYSTWTATRTTTTT